MKESINNTLNDILHSDIITKTKSGIHDLVSGVKNLFRHHSGQPEDNDKTLNINNHLKSPEEIEAEFRLLSALQANNAENETPETPSVTYLTIKNKTEVNIENLVIEEALPDYMEENY